MGWAIQFARVGNYRLNVRRTAVWMSEQKRARGGWSYELWRETETAITCVGRGSDVYDNVYGARQAAVLHLANILPKPQSERLLAGQAELVWETYRSSIPADATVMSLKKKASQCERQAAEESESMATLLRARAKLYRAQIAKLRSRRPTK